MTTAGGAALPPDAGAAALEAFRRLLERAAAPAEAESPVLLTDRLVGPAAGALLRRCAIPHEFDADLLGWLGDLDRSRAEAQYEAFTELSLIQLNDDTLSVHERWRAPLWAWWLAPAQRHEFVEISRQLVEWFSRRSLAAADDPFERRRMFHLLGCDRGAGLAEFDRLCRRARHRRRFSECTLLIRLVREYEPLLEPAERLQVDYAEAKLLIDLRQWVQALPLLARVADDPAADDALRAKAEARTAHAQRQLGRTEEAAALLERSLRRPATAGGARWRALYELGEIRRDQGRLDEALGLLNQALQAPADDDDPDRAGVLNSLGTVQLKLRETDDAIASFEASLEELKRRGDVLRPGTVLNNLGLAHVERTAWADAESAFRRSLETKREGGDLIGMATSWLNLARAQLAQGRAEDATASLQESLALSQRAGDARGVARARESLERIRARRAGPSGGAPAGGSPDATGGGGRVQPPVPTSIPWWAWALIVIGVLIVALLAVS